MYWVGDTDKYCVKHMLVIFMFAGISANLQAAGSGPVNNLVTSTQDAGADTSYTSPVDSEDYTWGSGDNLILDSFNHNGRNYTASDAIGPNQIIIRRNDNSNVSGERCRVFAETIGSGASNANTMAPAYPAGGPTGCSMESVLLGNVINLGTLDLFSNADSEGRNNIERVDYIVSGGVEVPNVAGVTEFMGIMASEKSGNNSFKVAAITSLDGAGNPGGFGPLVRIGTALSGQPIRYGLLGNPRTCNQFLEDEANPPQSGLLAGNRGSCLRETLGSVFVSLDDMGVNQGDTIFGYAWFPLDVTKANNLVDWTSFPTNTGNGNFPGNNSIDAGADIYGGLAGIFIPNLPDAEDDVIDGSSLTDPGDTLNINPLIDNGNGADTFGDDGPGTTPILLIDPVSGNPVSSITTSNGGTVSVNDGGSPNDPTDDFFEYTAPNTFNVTLDESFEYQICDADGPPECDTAKVTFSVTTPVTLSSFSSELDGHHLEVDWSTSSELFNVGFQLWGLDGTDGRWEKLHNWLVGSGSGNAVEPQSYSKRVRIPGLIEQLTHVGISSVDSDGTEHYYGPFVPGLSYGSLVTLKPIAWNQIRNQVDAKMTARGYMKDRHFGYRKVSPASASDKVAGVVSEISIREPGMYRITAQDLLNGGKDWRDVEQRSIALVDHNGNPVVRYVSAKGTGTGMRKTLGDSGEIYFYSPGVDSRAGLYSNTRRYRLVEDRYRSLQAQKQPKQGITNGYSAYYTQTTRVEHDKHYILNSAADDPWLDAVLLSYPNRTRTYTARIPVETDAIWSQPSTLGFDLARSSGLAPVDSDGDGQPDPEHVLEGVVLNLQAPGSLLSLGSQASVGRGEWQVNFEIPANSGLSLVDGEAIVGGHFNAGSGYAFSEVHVDATSLSYARPYRAMAGDDYLTFTGPNHGESGYEVTVPDRGWPQVFAYSDQGALVRLAIESQKRLKQADGSYQRVVKLAALNGAGTQLSRISYWVSGNRGFMQPESVTARNVTTASSLLAQVSGSNYLIIAHPAFMGSTLDSYAEFKRGQGHQVSVVDYFQIVETFGGGQPGPHGLTAYLAGVAEQGKIDYVLLVGGSTYDHLDKQGTGAITFIPGHYEESQYSSFTVSDAPYVVDTNGGFIASIGRWPVRSSADLQAIVDKSIAFSLKDRSIGHALAIAEPMVDGENIDFAASLGEITSLIPSGWLTTEVYVDEIAAANGLTLPGDLTLALSLSRARILNELDNAPDIVLYNGHGTTSQLSNKGLFSSNDAGRVNTRGAEMWLPMSCYVTFYESTHVNTLAHQLMFTGNAVNISGAMLLSQQSGNIAAGKAILDTMVNTNQSIGEAIKGYKTRQGSAAFKVNWALLGDPSLGL